jgi:hypothetical protein
MKLVYFLFFFHRRFKDCFSYKKISFFLRLASQMIQGAMKSEISFLKVV